MELTPNSRPCRASCCMALAQRAASPAQKIHHRRLDDLDRAVGPVQAHAAGFREEDRHPGARRRARHRPGARPGAARRCRRRVRARQSGRGEIHRRGPRREAPAGHVQRLRPDRAEDRSGEGRGRQGHRRGAAEGQGRGGAVRLARRPQRHAHGRARAVEGGRASTSRRRRARGIAIRGRAWGRRSTPRRR